jgi:hypothetical protein
LGKTRVTLPSAPIAHKRKIQLVFVVEFAQGVHGVATHPDHLGFQLFQFFLGITELVCLAGSTRSIGLGKEVEDNGFAGEVPDTHMRAGVRRQGKIRRPVTHIEHG